MRPQLLPRPPRRRLQPAPPSPRRSPDHRDAMATKAKSVNVDLNSVFGAAASQFRGLNPNEPGQWPMLPKLATWVALAIMVVVVGWFLLLTGVDDQLQAE